MKHQKEAVTYTLFGKSASQRYDEGGIHSLIQDADLLEFDVFINQFATEAERQAYYKGIEDSLGWEGYTEISPSDYKKLFDKIRIKTKLQVTKGTRTNGGNSVLTSLWQQRMTSLKPRIRT